MNSDGVRFDGLISLLFILAIHVSVESALAIESGRLSFGWAQTDITPQRPVAIAGQYHTRIGGTVNDPLTATALALETRSDDGVIDQAVLVSCDLVVIRKLTQVRVREIAKTLVKDLDVNKILVSATHTHTAPALTDVNEKELHPYDFAGSWAYRIPADRKDVMHPTEYLELLAQRLARVAVDAWTRRKPGGVSSALGHAAIAYNRRAVYKDGRAVMYGNTEDPNFSHIEGVSDQSVDVLFLWRGKQLEGMAINVYCTSQEVEGAEFLSADFWHDARELLREQYGKSLFVLPLCGASGDQSPHLLWDKTADGAMLNRRGVSRRRDIGRRIVAAVNDVLETGRAGSATEIPFEHRVETVPLPVWLVSDDRNEASRKVFEAGRDRTDKLRSHDYINWRVSRTLMARHAYQKTHPNYQAELHMIRLGQVAIATNPFELYTDYGVRIKA
jgi:hypothetical protein